MLRFVLAATCQFLEPDPMPGEAGQPVAVRAVDVDGAPIAGLDVSVRVPQPAGSATVPLGPTDAGGAVTFVPSAPGAYELRARLPRGGPLLVAPLRVVAPRQRWLWAAACVPLGLLFLWLQWRAVRASIRRRGIDDGPE